MASRLMVPKLMTNSKPLAMKGQSAGQHNAGQHNAGQHNAGERADDREPLRHFIDAARNCRDEEAERLSQTLVTADVPALLTLSSTGEENFDLRWWAIRGLAVCGEQNAVTLLAESLADPEPEIRAAAALSLGHIGQRMMAAGQMFSNADGQPNKPVDEQNVIRSMAGLLSDGQGFVRQAGADALALLEGEAVFALQEVLASGPESARVRAAYSLRKIGTRSDAVNEAAPALFQILNDSNYLVHTYAHEALDEMGLLDNVLVVL